MASIRRCRRCGELFVPGIFGVNLLVVRIRRCGVCGKFTPLFIWGDGPEAEQLHESSQKEKVPELDEDEVLRRRIEESKYDRP